MYHFLFIEVEPGGAAPPGTQRSEHSGQDTREDVQDEDDRERDDGREGGGPGRGGERVADGQVVVAGGQPERGVGGKRQADGAGADGQTHDDGRQTQRDGRGADDGHGGEHRDGGGADGRADDHGEHERVQHERDVDAAEQVNERVAEAAGLQHGAEAVAAADDHEDVAHGVGRFVDVLPDALADGRHEVLMQHDARDEHGDEQGHVVVADEREEHRGEVVGGQHDAAHGVDDDENDGQRDEREDQARGGLVGVGLDELVVVEDLGRLGLAGLPVGVRELLVEDVGVLPAAQQARGQGHDDAVDDEPADVRADLAGDGERAGRGRDDAVRQQQAGEQRRHVGARLFLREFLQAGDQRAERDVRGTEVHRDGDDEAREVERQHIVFLAERAQQALGELFHAAGIAQHGAEDAAEQDEQADARHDAAEAAGHRGERVGERHAAQKRHQHGAREQRDARADLTFDDDHQKHDHGDHERKQNIHSVFPPLENALRVVAQHPAGIAARELHVVVDHFAADDHVVDALGQAVGLVVRGGVLQAVKVEQDEVGVVAVADEALVLHQQVLGGQTRHLADDLLERHDVLLLDEVRDGVRERGARAGMSLLVPRAGERVGADDAVRVAEDLANVLVAHAAVHAAGGAVVDLAQVEERLPRVLADGAGVVRDGLALRERRFGGGVDVHALPAAGVQIVVVVRGGGVFHLGAQLAAEVLVRELRRHGRKAVREVPRRHAGVQRRHVAGVGVLVADDAHALVVRLVDEAQRLLLLAPVGLAEHLVVRDVHAHARLAAHVDGLLHRVHDEVRLVAHVAGVDAVERLDDLRQLHDLLGLGIAARRVDQYAYL